MKIPKRWTDQVGFDLDFAEKVLRERGELRPMFSFMSAEDQLVLIPGHYRNEAEKERFLELVRLLATAHDAQWVTFLSEAWVRSVERRAGETDAEYDARAEAVPPSEAEDRIEVVISVVCYRNGGRVRTASGTAEVLRGDDGKPTGLGPREEPHGDDTGRFAELLPLRRPSRDERAEAKALVEEAGFSVQPVVRPN